SMTMRGGTNQTRRRPNRDSPTEYGSAPRVVSTSCEAAVMASRLVAAIHSSANRCSVAGCHVTVYRAIHGLQAAHDLCQRLARAGPLPRFFDLLVGEQGMYAVVHQPSV